MVSDYFDRMIELFPPKLYLPQEPNRDQWKNKFSHNVKGSAPKQLKKEQSKKGKKLKFRKDHKTLKQQQLVSAFLTW